MALIVSVAQMRAIESEADRKGVSYDRMMDRAGLAVFTEARKQFGPAHGKRVILLCGGGNNGGDGLAAALLFAREEADVRVFLASDRKENDPRRKAVAEAGIPLGDATTASGRDAMISLLEDADLLVDAVLGTGVRLPLRPPVADILLAVRSYLAKANHHLHVVSVDCPSGLDCDTGELAKEAFPADLTITLGAAKPGLLIFPGAEYVGRLLVADIGIPAGLDSLRVTGPMLATPETIRGWLKKRPRDSHKGTFGRVLIIGGSVNYPGAPALAGQGAYRIGAGLVTLAVPVPVYSAAVSLLPEATWIVLPEDMGVIAEGAVEVLLPEALQSEAIVLGPGFGREKATSAFLKSFLQEGLGRKTPIGFGIPEPGRPSPAIKGKRPPIVVDADGLKLIAELENGIAMLPPGSVLTPHPGEMAVLTGLSKEEIQKDRPGTALRFAKQWNFTVVLKGAFTVAAAPDGRIAIEPFATPALARAGTGDVLAGVIGGLIAQGIGSWEAAVLGAYLHGRAGELAAEDQGAADSVLAGDVARALHKAIAELR